MNLSIISGIVLFITYFIMKWSVQKDGITDINKFKGEDATAKAVSGRNFDNAITGILVLSVILMMVPNALDEMYLFPSTFVLNVIVLILSTVAFGSLDKDAVKNGGRNSLIMVIAFSVIGLIASGTLQWIKVTSENREQALESAESGKRWEQYKINMARIEQEQRERYGK